MFSVLGSTDHKPSWGPSRDCDSSGKGISCGGFPEEIANPVTRFSQQSVLDAPEAISLSGVPQETAIPMQKEFLVGVSLKRLQIQ